MKTLTIALRNFANSPTIQQHWISQTHCLYGAWGSVVAKALRYESVGPGIEMTLGIYSVAADISVCPGVDSASKNEYQDIPGGKGGRCVGVTTLPPSCVECLLICSLNRPEPSGPHRPVIGIALPYLYCRCGRLLIRTVNRHNCTTYQHEFSGR